MMGALIEETIQLRSRQLFAEANVSDSGYLEWRYVLGSILA
jgi:hypothetical protein